MLTIKPHRLPRLRPPLPHRVPVRPGRPRVRLGRRTRAALGPHPLAAGAVVETHQPHPLTRTEKRAARRDARESQQAALRTRAAALVSQATGRAYERVGLVAAGRRRLAYIAFGLVLLCVGYMSWTGEYEWATHELLWTAVMALMVPVALDMAAIVCTMLAADQIDKGESGFAFRVLAAVFMGLGAWINWRYALRSRNVTEEVFFPAMSVLAYSIIHAVLAAARREARRRQYGHKSKQRVEPLPRFGLLAWLPGLGAPKEALDATRLSVRMRLAASLAAAGLAALESEDEQGAADGDALPPPPPPDQDALDTAHLATLSLAESVRWVLAERCAAGLDAAAASQAVTAFLRGHGQPLLKASRVTDVLKRAAPASPPAAP